MTPEELMQKGISLMKTKNQDYTSGDTTRYENFIREAELIGWFKNDFDKAYVALIAVKLTRLASLLDVKEPKHESIEDTFIDLVNYCALWGGFRTSSLDNPSLPESESEFITTRSDDEWKCDECRKECLGPKTTLNIRIMGEIKNVYHFCSIQHLDRYVKRYQEVYPIKNYNQSLHLIDR